MFAGFIPLLVNKNIILFLCFSEVLPPRSLALHHTVPFSNPSIVGFFLGGGLKTKLIQRGITLVLVIKPNFHILQMAGHIRIQKQLAPRSAKADRKQPSVNICFI